MNTCLKGHELTAGNVYWRSDVNGISHPECRTCIRARVESQARASRRRAEVNRDRNQAASRGGRWPHDD